MRLVLLRRKRPAHTARTHHKGSGTKGSPHGELYWEDHRPETTTTSSPAGECTHAHRRHPEPPQTPGPRSQDPSNPAAAPAKGGEVSSGPGAADTER